MALRPRLSTGLPLSNEQMVRFQQKEPGKRPGSRRVSDGVIFGNLAILIPYGGMVDPMALRPRLSTGLLLSDVVGYIIARDGRITPFILVIPAYRIETIILLVSRRQTTFPNSHSRLPQYRSGKQHDVPPHRLG
jgi:hypothetical protein